MPVSDDRIVMNPLSPPPAISRIFGWSDLHVDHAANFRLVTQMSRQDFQHDLLLLAGDVSSQLNRSLATLQELRARFREVAFVPGNHDLWVNPGDTLDSLGKLQALLARCRDSGVRTAPFTCSLAGQAVRIVPLLSWYLKPEEGTGSLYLAKPGEDPELRMWADNYRIKWPVLPEARTPAEHLLAINSTPRPTATTPAETGTTISFSHFLPRVELVFSDWEAFQAGRIKPGHDRAPEFNFTRVAGCRQLDERLRQHGSRVHLYGHQHRNRDRRIEGVRYVSHCLGYPGEQPEPSAQPARELPLEIRLGGAE